MKKINKRPQPTEIQQWRAANAGIHANLRYNSGGFPRSAVLKALLVEQGNLCAYTLLKIDDNKAHIEHLKPQNKCLAEDDEREAHGRGRKCEDVEWRNMVACFPQPGADHPRFGAVEKNEWWHKTDFVSPLAQNCELRFRYEKDGKIHAVNDTDNAVKTTIIKLRLHSKRLEELRKKAIMQAGLHKSSPKAIRSVSTVEQLIKRLKEKPADGYLEFCTVLEQVAIDYIKALQKRAKRRRHVVA